MRKLLCAAIIVGIGTMGGCAAMPAPQATPLAPIFTPGIAVTPSSPATAETDSPNAAVSPDVKEPIALATIEVPKYCICYGPRDQAQVKLKVGVTNGSESPIAISADRWRLVVTHDFVTDWTPISPTADKSSREGATLIPPNADNAAEALDGAYTFATHWDASQLDPGGTYLDTAVKRGDLVFYVPVASDQTIALSGLALLAANSEEVIGFLPSSEFKAASEPNNF